MLRRFGRRTSCAPRISPTRFLSKGRMLERGDRFLSGGTMIVAPGGEVIEGPVKDEERIIYADLDPAKVLEERQNFDPAGHYARADRFDLLVDRRRVEGAAFVDEEEDGVTTSKRR